MGKDLGFENIAVATDPFQSQMVKSFAKRKKLDVTYIPVIFETLRTYYNDVNVSIDPTKAEVENFVSLPEKNFTLKSKKYFLTSLYSENVS